MHYEWCSLTAIGSSVEDRGCVDVVSVKWISVAKIAEKSGVFGSEGIRVARYSDRCRPWSSIWPTESGAIAHDNTHGDVQGTDGLAKPQRHEVLSRSSMWTLVKFGMK